MKACAECGLVNPDEAITCPGCNGQSWASLAPPIPGAVRLDPVSEPGKPGAFDADDTVVCPACTEPNPSLLTRCRRCRGPLSGGATMLAGYEAGAVQQGVTMTRRHKFIAFGIWILSIPCTVGALLNLALTVLRWDREIGPAMLLVSIILVVITGSVTWFGARHWIFGRT